MRILLPMALVLLSAIPVLAEGVLRVVSPWEIGTLDPSRGGYVFTRMQVTETLLGADDSGLPQPGLATSWAVSEDRLTWRLTLREGAVFHDGSPVRSGPPRSRRSPRRMPAMWCFGCPSRSRPCQPSSPITAP